MGRRNGRCMMDILCMCAALMLALAIPGMADQSGDFTYTRLDGGGLEITGWTGEGTILEVPAEIDGMAVVSVADGAFAGHALVERADLPEGLEALGDGAFADCYSLEEVRIPSTVARVGQNPFAGCENLKKMDLAEGQACLSLVNGVLFGDEGRRLIFCPRILPMERCVVPEGTERIDARAFSYCSKLLSVTLPDSVTDIGAEAFEGRVNLTLVVGRGSCGEAYAKQNDIKFTYPDAAEWLAESPK